MTKVLHIIGPRGVGKTNLAADICLGKRSLGMSCESLNDLGLFDSTIGDPGLERMRHDGFLPHEHHTAKVDMLILDYVDEPPAGFVQPGDIVLRMDRAGDNVVLAATKAVIFTAPQGWGKGFYAAKLQQAFGCNSVVDEWSPGLPVVAGALHLSNCSAELIRDAMFTNDAWRGVVTAVIDTAWYCSAQTYFGLEV